MPELRGDGVEVMVPRGWDGEIYEREPVGDESAAASQDTTIVHTANFALPPVRGDFGSGAVEVMRGGGILIVLFEYDHTSAGTPLFAHRGVPRRLSPDDFDPQGLQRALPGQSGTQVFFNEAGRAFCLYVVLGSHRRRNVLVPLVNEVLATIQIT